MRRGRRLFCRPGFWLASPTKLYLPFSELTDEIQLFHDHLKGKELFIFKGFLSVRRENTKYNHKAKFLGIWTVNLRPPVFSMNKSNELTICVPTLNAKETISRRCFVLGPFRVFSAKTRADSTSRRCSLYFLSEITLFLKIKQKIIKFRF